MTTDAEIARAGGPPAWRAAVGSPEFALSLGIAACLAIAAAVDPDRALFRAGNLADLAHFVALYGVLALGASVVIIAGGIDLSSGSLVAFSSVVAAKLLTAWLPGADAGPGAPTPVAVAAIALAILAGGAVGLYHAALINLLRLPPFIATLASLAGLRSVAALISGSRPIAIRSAAFRALGRYPAYSVAIFLALAAAIGVVMGLTVLGRHLYALGGNEAAARLGGLPTRRLKTIAYALSGMLSALGGVLWAGKVGSGYSTLGLSFELYAITAAVVGGCSLSGGVGSIRGTILGLVLIQLVVKATGLVVRGVDSTQVEGLISGAVVILAVALNQRFRGRA